MMRDVKVRERLGMMRDARCLKKNWEGLTKRTGILSTNETSHPTMCSIELDCAPGPVRPNHLFLDVIAGTQLNAEDFHEPTRMFGNWEWELKPGEDRQRRFADATAKVRERIERLHRSGAIRYGSW
jgi:hypothetical protein